MSNAKQNELVGENKDSNDEHKIFKKKILRLNAIASNRCSQEGFDVDKAAAQSEHDLNVLGATNGLQEMLAAQMLSIHHLQQLAMAYANEVKLMDERQYYTNAAIKLANCFTQQANLLARLQGNGNQKIIIERVDVHQGGQAVVGSIHGGSEKK
jgi:hypothetical protein